MLKVFCWKIRELHSANLKPRSPSSQLQAPQPRRGIPSKRQARLYHTLPAPPITAKRFYRTNIAERVRAQSTPLLHHLRTSAYRGDTCPRVGRVARLAIDTFVPRGLRGEGSAREFHFAPLTEIFQRSRSSRYFHFAKWRCRPFWRYRYIYRRAGTLFFRELVITTHVPVECT